MTSSPVVPSPRVAAPDQPAALVDQVDGQAVDLELAEVARRAAPSRSARAAQAESSSEEKALSRLCMRSGWVTGAKVAPKPPLTFWLGDSGVTRAGWAASSALSSPISSSYWPSLTSGASWT